jgi:hypothetical protein
MGAWGRGPLQNDNALDLVEDIKAEIKRDKNYRKMAKKKDFRTILKDFFSYYDLNDIRENKIKSSIVPYDPKEERKNIADSIMVGAAYFMSIGCNITNFVKIIDKAIDLALANIEDEGWRDPEKRKEALEYFKKQVHGESIPKDKQEEYDMTLADKVTDFLQK